MTDLWEVHGSHWTLPVRAQLVEENIVELEIGAGVPLMKTQREALTQVLTPYLWEAKGATFISEKDLRSNANPSQETDPEAIVQWWPRFKPAQSANEVAWEEEEFLKRFVAVGWVENVKQAAIYWRAFRKCMFHWLVIEGRVLHLGFVKLCMLPYRANWKAAVLGSLGEDWMDVRVEEVSDKVLQLLGHPELLAVFGPRGNRDRQEVDAQRHSVLHTIDVVHTAEFYRQIKLVEKERDRSFRVHYWKSVGNRMADVSDFAHEALAQTVAQMRRPYPFAHGYDGESRPDLPRWWREMDFNLASAREPRSLPVAVDRHTGHEQERFISSLDSAPSSVPPVPDV